MKHTPGPWIVYNDKYTGLTAGAFPGIESRGDNPCTIVLFGDVGEDDLGVHGHTPEEAIANALLIAACPDLLAACKETVRIWELGGLRAVPGDGSPIGTVAAAIAKAERKE